MFASFSMKNQVLARTARSAFAVVSVVVISTGQASALEVNPVVITASRLSEPLADVLPAVSVITRQEIEKSQAQSLADLLQGEAGAEFGRNGGPGSVTSFFLRGQNSTNLAIFIDGVRTQVDAYGSLTMTDFPLQQIERIEILRGNASALYGEAAVGGVVHIFTKTGKGRPAAYGSLGLGSYGTKHVHAGYGGQYDDLTVDLSFSQSHTDGFSAMDTQVNRGANPDRDGNLSRYAGARLEKKISNARVLGLRLSALDLETEYDKSSERDKSHRFDKSTQTLGTYWRERLTSDWQSQLDFSFGNFAYDDLTNSTNNGRYRGSSKGLKWFNTYQLQEQTVLNFGLDHATESYRLSGSYDVDRSLSGQYLGISHKLGQMTFQGNLRHDRVHVEQTQSTANGSKDNGASSYLLGLGYPLNPSWRITASTSTGFRTPAAGELFGPWGNMDLKPEKFKTDEAGFVYQQSTTLARAVFFRTRSTNAIVYGNDYVPYNAGEVKNQGLEFSLRSVWQGNRIRMTYVAQDPKNVSEDTRLARRARAYGSAEVFRQIHAYDLGARVVAAGNRLNMVGDSALLPGYALVSLFADRKIDESWTLRAKLDNAFDQKYVLARGYNTPGRGFYLTLQYSPK